MSGSCSVEYKTVVCPQVMAPSAKHHVMAAIRNAGSTTLKGMLAHSVGNVSLAYHWKELSGNFVVWDDGARAPILADFPPGGEAILFLSVVPPSTEGTFVLQLTLVSEEGWFEAQGPTTHEIVVDIRAPSPSERERLRRAAVEISALDSEGEAMRVFVVEQATGIWGNNSQQTSYYKMNARRYAATARILQNRIGPGPLRVLNIGYSPIWSLLLRTYLPLWEQHHGDIQLNPMLVPAQRPSRGSSDVELRPVLAPAQGSPPLLVDRVDMFDAEKDRFPYEDGFFDVVIVAELIEHLLLDPMFTVSEANRVLKMGGSLVVTTPNVARLDAVKSLLEHGGDHPFTCSAYAEKGHHREYTPAEIQLLLVAGGFGIDFFDTFNVWPLRWSTPVLEETFALLEKTGYPTTWRGQDVVAVGKKEGTIRYRRPWPLYLTAETTTVVCETDYE